MKFRALTKITGIFSALFLTAFAAHAETAQLDEAASATMISVFGSFEQNGQIVIKHIDCSRHDMSAYVCTYLPQTGVANVNHFEAYQLWPVSAYRVGSTLAVSMKSANGAYTNRYGVSFRSYRYFVTTLSCQNGSCQMEY